MERDGSCRSQVTGRIGSLYPAGRQNTSARSRSTGTKQSRSTASRSKKQQTGGESRVALGIILAALVLGLIARAISMGLV